MEFKALYHGDRLKVINPNGDVGIVTLWSKVDSLFDILVKEGINLDPTTSRIAVIGNLYGNGLPHMLRNLLHNPQIKHLIICGKDLSGSRMWLVNFFERGLEEVDFLGARVWKIIGTDRVIDGEVRPEHFVTKPDFQVLGDISSEDTKEVIRIYLDHLESLGPLSTETFQRVDPPGIPEPVVTRFPSHPSTHLIHRATPLEAWSELVFRLYRFGHRNRILKSTGPEERLELLDTHVVVDDPREESKELLNKFGFNLSRFQQYQRDIVDPLLPTSLTYSYGWLLRTGLDEEHPVDSLQIIADRLKGDHDSRQCFATTWNNAIHLPRGQDSPCLVSLFFRQFEGKLTLSATFRVHNAMDAWLENLYGLRAIQSFVALRADMEKGPITMISHSISIDPSSLDRAKRMVDERTSDDTMNLLTGKRELRFDPNGSFTVTFDRTTWELVVEHNFQGMKIGEYRGNTAEEVEKQLSRDMALTLVSHALYLGRELARKEHEMKVAKVEAKAE